MPSIRHRPGLGSAVVCTCVLSLIACSSGPRLRHKHEFELSPGSEYHAGLKTAVLIPIDYANEGPIKGLDKANDRISALISRHFESMGVRVEPVDAVRFEQTAKTVERRMLEARKSGASGVVSATIELSDIVPEVLERLEISPDLLIAADVVMRRASYHGERTIVWDGVKRREWATDVSMSGGVPAASLHGAIYSKDGTKVFAGYGGLEPVFRLEIGRRKYVEREDFLEDDRNLREGICIAFYPYFGRDASCRR